MAAERALKQSQEVVSKNQKKDVPAFGLRDKLGYMFGDFGNDFTFILSSSFMLKFYTDVMGISAGVVGMLMMLARFLDAFTDVTMGQLVDRSKPTKDGKFKPWIKRMSGPVAISCFLMFQSGIAGMPYGFKVAWMFVTYILWGSIFYTSINIPYGSMASAVSPEAKDRAELSTWRTIGATLAGTVIGVGTPMFAYVTVNGNQVLSGPRMTIIAGVFGVLAIICHLLCFKLTRERVEVPANTQKLDLGKMFKSIFTNRSLLGIIAVSIILLMTSLSLQGLSSYVYPNYYRDIKPLSMSALLTSACTLAICAPFASKLAAKFGKKELAIVSCLTSSVVYAVCFFVRPASPYVFLAFTTVAGIANGFFSLITWAMITDVIDDSEVRNGVREDGTIYSVYSFARKMGQALSSGLVGALLGAIGYTELTAFAPEVTSKIFSLATLLPAIGFFAVTLALIFLYPLNKKKVDANIAELSRRRNG